MTIFKAKDLSKDIWQSLLKHLDVPDKTRMIIEAPEQAIFTWFADYPIPFEICTRGRIFHVEGELKWRRIDGFYRSVFLGKEDWVGDILDDAADELEGLLPENGEMVLWGMRTDLADEWIEQSVPHRFNYPFEGGSIPYGRLKLITENWRDSLGRLVLTRFLDLLEMEGENAAK